MYLYDISHNPTTEEILYLCYMTFVSFELIQDRMLLFDQLIGLLIDRIINRIIGENVFVLLHKYHLLKSKGRWYVWHLDIYLLILFIKFICCSSRSLRWHWAIIDYQPYLFQSLFSYIRFTCYLQNNNSIIICKLLKYIKLYVWKVWNKKLSVQYVNINGRQFWYQCLII